MNDDRPFLQIPLESEEELRMYEEWLKKQKEREEENNEDELLFSPSADETKWLFPHRIDPLLIEEEDLRTTVRSGRSERSCHVWFENGCVRFFFALFVCVRCGRFFLSLSCLFAIFSQRSPFDVTSSSYS